MNVSAWNPLAPFIQIHRHRALLGQFARRAIELRHKGSVLGLAWTILTPLVSLAIYTIVFGFVFGGRFTDSPTETNLDYALGVFLGLVLFHFLADVLSQTPSVIVSQPNFVKKVVFPLEILPVALVIASAFAASLSLILALLGVMFIGPGLGWPAWQLLLIVPPVILLALGLAWFLSALGVFLRDIASAMPFVVQIVVYTSAIFYPLRRLEVLPASLQAVLLCNPLLHAVENTRRVLLWHQPVDTGSLLFLWSSGIVVCVLGYLTFQKLRPAFADVI